MRDNSRYDVVEAASAVRGSDRRRRAQDAIVDARGGQPADRPARSSGAARVLKFARPITSPAARRKGGTAGPPSDGILRIATNLLDVPAEIIAEIYRQRWTIELFFRFFKHVLGLPALAEHGASGNRDSDYCAIIACLLLALWTGGKPTLRTYEMVCLYLQGWADEEELLAHLKKLKPQPPRPTLFSERGSLHAAHACSTRRRKRWTHQGDDYITTLEPPLPHAENGTATREPNRRGSELFLTK